jgi:hypothetical protein
MFESNSENFVNARSADYFIAQTETRCWRCSQMTPVLGLALPPNHEVLATDDEIASGEDIDLKVEQYGRDIHWNEIEGSVDAPQEVQVSRENGGDECLQEEAWQREPLHAFLFYIEYLPLPIQHRLQQLSSHYRLDFSQAIQGSYWMNHCQHCGMKQGDNELFCEPEGAFMPLDAGGAAAIRLLQVCEPFEAAAAGYAFEPHFFENMRRE